MVHVSMGTAHGPGNYLKVARRWWRYSFMHNLLTNSPGGSFEE